MHFDFLLIGQGIAGTLLSYELKKKGCTVLVVDDGNSHASSRVAGGVLNPINGKALWQTGRQIQFQTAALAKYQELEQAWGFSLLSEMPLLQVHTEERLRIYFEERSKEIPALLQPLTPEEAAAYQPFFEQPFGIGAIRHCQVIATGKILSFWRDVLRQEGLLLEEKWLWEELQLKQEGIAYKSYTAGKLVCCEGAAVRENPFFSGLPFTKNKGEALLVSIPGLPRQAMYQHGIRLIPWQDTKDVFWVGSNQTWDYEELAKDEAWRAKTLQLLNSWLRLDVELVDHLFAERPTTAGQIIFAGRHPERKQLVLFNGLGTRGFSAGPFYAAQLAGQLCGAASLPLLNHKGL